MQKKLTPLHYILATGKGTGEETIQIYDGAYSQRAIKARLKKERRDHQWAKMYRLSQLWCFPDGSEIWGTYENIENSEDTAYFAVV